MKWPEIELGSLCTIASGYPFESAQFTEDPGDVALVKGENVGQGEILWDISKRWSREQFQDLSRFRLDPDDVVLAMDRPWVPAGLKFARLRSSDPEALLVQRVARLRAFEGLDQRYLYHAIAAPEFSSYVRNVARGVGVPHISGGQIADYRFRLPPLAVQRRIADILSAYDDQIDNNRRRMALLENAARQLYQEWFVRLRFPGYEHTRIVDGLPEGWEESRLGDVLTMKRGYDLPEARRVAGDFPVVSSSGITGFHDIGMASAPGVVTGRYGTLGEVYYLRREYWPLNTALYVCDFKGNSPGFVAHLLMHALTGIQSDKAAVPGLNRNAAHGLVVLCPPKTLRSEFGAFAELTFQQVDVLRNINVKLRAACDLLLPRLMSGEIAV